MVFKDIPEYEKLYKINTSGTVKNASGKILKPYVNENGYERITLFKNGVKKGHYIHRLIADVFIKNTDKTKNQIDHISRVRTENELKNLRRVSPIENSNNRTFN